MFPPVVEDSPLDPASVRKRLQTVLERAGCKKVRFHDLRHTFATTALEHGMDTKTLSTIIGHVSTSTTLNIYAHVTDEMRRTAAAKIDRGIGKAETQKINHDAAPRKPARPLSSHTKASGASRAQAVSRRSLTTCGKAATPPSGRTERNTHAMSTPTVKMNANDCWRR